MLFTIHPDTPAKVQMPLLYSVLLILGSCFCWETFVSWMYCKAVTDPDRAVLPKIVFQDKNTLYELIHLMFSDC